MTTASARIYKITVRAFLCIKHQILLIVPKFNCSCHYKICNSTADECVKTFSPTQSHLMWQDVRLSNKFFKQTSNNKHYNTTAQVQESPTIFFDRTAWSTSSSSVKNTPTTTRYPQHVRYLFAKKKKNQLLIFFFNYRQKKTVMNSCDGLIFSAKFDII